MAAIQLASGQSLTAGVISAQAMTLMEGVIGTMFTTKLKISAVVLATTCGFAVPTVLALQFADGPPNRKNQFQPKLVKAFDEQPKPAPQPVSPDAVMLIKMSEKALATIDQLVANGQVNGNIEPTYTWSRRLVLAKSGPGVSVEDRKAALQAHHDRMLKLSEQAMALAAQGKATVLEVLESHYRMAEAFQWVQDGQIGGDDDRPKTAGGGFRGGMAIPGGGLRAGGPGDGPMLGGLRGVLTLDQTPADEKRNEAIRVKLDEKISMNFSTPTSLEDVKKYLEQMTEDEAGGFPNGLPIYIDPDGLEGAEAKMTSPITINLENVPLRTTLRLALRQLGLEYRIAGGVLLISDVDSIALEELKARRLGSQTRQ